MQPSVTLPVNSPYHCFEYEYYVSATKTLIKNNRGTDLGEMMAIFTNPELVSEKFPHFSARKTYLRETEEEVVEMSGAMEAYAAQKTRSLREANTQLSNANTQLSNANTQLSNANTQLSNANTQLNKEKDAVLTSLKNAYQAGKIEKEVYESIVEACK